jgi:hypothetical protein
MDLRRFVRISPPILSAALILLALASNFMAGFRVETDKETCLVGENVTATIILYNNLPFTTPYPAVTKVEFDCTLNGESLRKEYGVHLTPQGPFYFASPGSETWLFPITVTPQVNGDTCVHGENRR